MAEKEALRLFAPGPVWVPERIRRAMSRPLVHHRTPEFAAVVAELRERLPRVWRTPGWESLVFCCSGTGAMEGAVSNFMRRGAKAVTVSSGKFGERWAKILESYGCDLREVRLPWGATCTAEAVRDLLAREPDIRGFYLTSADTSTGAVHPIGELCRAIRQASDALIVVDCICDFGGVDIRPQDWDCDVVISASQKCLMCPPGLGLASVSPRAWQFAATSDLPRFYFDWTKERDRQRSGVTGSTSAVTLLWALLESLRMIEEEGLPSVFARHRRVGGAVRAGVGALGLSLFSEVPTDVVTVVRCPEGKNGVEVYERMASAYGYRIANGQDQIKGQVFRLGHMGVISDGDALGLLGALERALGDLGFAVPRRGTAQAAALEAFELADGGA